MSGLKRTDLRRYLNALLQVETVVQSADCETGPLWQNCDDTSISVYDHASHQIFENTDPSYQLDNDCAAIIFSIDSVKYSFLKTRIDKNDIRFNIDIVANAESGKKRQDVLDQIEARILYRMFEQPTFVDTVTGEKLRSFMTWPDQNRVACEVKDESDFKGEYTLRRMMFSMTTNECIGKTDCGDIPLCFDFMNLTVLDDAC